MHLIWFRSDLRLTDNSALWNARLSDSCMACVLLAEKQWRQFGHGDNKIQFYLQQAAELKARLESINIPCLLETLDDFSHQQQRLMEICSEHGIKRVYYNREYPLDERKRDEALQKKLAAKGIETQVYQDALVMPPGSVTTQGGGFFKVYTPFKRAWLKQVEGEPLDLLDIDQATPEHASQVLQAFCNAALMDYDKNRDMPDLQATSELSAHLSIGSISPRQCLAAATAANGGEMSSGNPGAVAWISQIIWREFYFHLIALQPDLSRGLPFKPETDQIPWRQSDDNFQAWREGKTGVPFVDAGMRQLNQTGWMHNRLRMVTAMYLTKNLLIDWRQGERYFLDKLVDGDFALNNGGWQWSASTGTDAAPYFRVFNPFSQAKRFDPQGHYIKRFVPELAELPAAILHDETKLTLHRPPDYPAQITDLKRSRAQAIDAFKRLGKGNTDHESNSLF